MKCNSSVYLTLILLFMICFPQISFGQNVSSNFSNTAKSLNLTGLYTSNNDDKYYLKQMGNSIWWLGTDKNGSLIKNSFKGDIVGNTIKGQWIDLPLNLTTTKGGSINFTISFNSGNVSISKLNPNENFPITNLNKIIPVTNNATSFAVRINHINVITPRAPLYDVLFAGLSAKKDNGEPITSEVYLGNSESNSNISLNLNVGPFNLDKSDNGVTVEFIGLNKENAESTSTLINIKEILDLLFDPSFNSFDLSSPGQGDSTIRALSPDLYLYACNGPVFVDKIFIPKGELIKSFNSGTGYSREKMYLGPTPPSGCGTHSKYQVKWSIIPLK